MSFYRDFEDNLALAQWNEARREAYSTIRLKRITPPIGAEVEGIDLKTDLSAAQFDELRRALAENLVLVFRHQDVGAEDQKRLARRFGTLHRHVLASNKVIAGATPDPEILGWKTGKETRYTAGDAWRSDVSCDATPIFASLLRVTKTPEVGGGDTAFANMYLAYEALSDRLKALLAGLTAVHDGAFGWTQGYGAAPSDRSFPTSEHPIVARHPVSGRPFLYVNRAFTSRIVGLPRRAGDVILKLLLDTIEQSLVFQVRVRWEPNTLVLWDNWASQHHAVWDYYPFERWGNGFRPTWATVRKRREEEPIVREMVVARARGRGHLAPWQGQCGRRSGASSNRVPEGGHIARRAA